MEKGRRQRTTLFEKKKAINRERRKVEKDRLNLMELREPHAIECGKLERELAKLQKVSAELGTKYETGRALIRRAESELAAAHNRVREAKLTLADEKRALELRMRKERELLQKQKDVAADAAKWRERFDEEAAQEAAVAAAAAAEAAAIADAKAKEERRKEKAAAEHSAKLEAEAAEAAALEALIAAAKNEGKRWTIGQRVRIKKSGQVGTVANIKIAGATGLDGTSRPGLSVKLDGLNADGARMLFLTPQEIIPFDYGTKSVEPVPAARKMHLDRRGKRPLDGVPVAGVPVPMRKAGQAWRESKSRQSLSPTKARMGYILYQGDQSGANLEEIPQRPFRRDLSPLTRPSSVGASLSRSWAGGGNLSQVPNVVERLYRGGNPEQESLKIARFLLSGCK